jgi:hypothetical protein
MTGRILAFYALAALIPTVHLSGQQADDRLTALRAAGRVRRLEAPGAVPVFYVPSAEWRAVRIQKAVEATYAWYEKQLQLHDVQVTVAVLDKEVWKGLTGLAAYPMPNYSRGLVVMPEVGPADQVVFGGLDHELGHIFADSLKIRSGNPFMTQVFAAGYHRAHHIDLAPISPFTAGTSPRYTSLADLDYLYNDVGDKNYYWLQDQLYLLADVLVGDQSFPAVIEKLRAAFPADHQKHETLEQIQTHLEGIRPGFIKMAGPLAGPSTITRIKPSACQDTSEKGGPSSSGAIIVIQNDTAGPLAVTRPSGNTFTVPPHAFVTSQVRVGASLKLPDGTCLAGRDEPALAVIEKQ